MAIAVASSTREQLRCEGNRGGEGFVVVRFSQTYHQDSLTLQSQLDELVAAECVRCGDAMVRSIDKPFISDDDMEFAIKSWYLCE